MAEQKSVVQDYETPYKFTGKELDEETGLYYFGARYYDPKVSIWMSVDPLAEKYQACNPYNFCSQNPIKLIDPNGKQPSPRGLIKKWNDLNYKEKDILLYDMGFYKVSDIEDNAAVATAMTISVYGDNGKGDESDAFRHAYWQALNTQDVGVSFTQKWSDAHEYSTPVNELGTDIYMDIHNNNVGVEIGPNNPKATPDQLKKIVLEEIKKGKMIIINSNGKLIKSDGTTIKKSEIRRADTAGKIGVEVKKNANGQNTKYYD